MIVGSLSLVIVHNPGRRREISIYPSPVHILDHLDGECSVPPSQTLGQDVNFRDDGLGEVKAVSFGFQLRKVSDAGFSD